MCAFFSKTEDGTSEEMKQAVKEAFISNLSDFEKMKNIAKAYITKCECSVQEAVYLFMTELWLQKTFPKVKFFKQQLARESL